MERIKRYRGGDTIEQTPTLCSYQVLQYRKVCAVHWLCRALNLHYRQLNSTSALAVVKACQAFKSCSMPVHRKQGELQANSCLGN